MNIKNRKHRVLALIPARGGSKRLPGKNIKIFCGRPLIHWTIAQALRSRLVNSVVVSTDDRRIARAARVAGARVPFMRPARLASDKSSTFDAVAHTIDFLRSRGEKYDILALLEPTSPLRKKEDIDNAIAMLIKNYNRADAVVSLGKVHLESPYVMKTVNRGRIRPLMASKIKFHQSQQLPPAYFPYGVIYLVKISTLLRTRSFYPARTLPHFIERWQNYEIDDIYDFQAVSAVFKSAGRKMI